MDNKVRLGECLLDPSQGWDLERARGVQERLAGKVIKKGGGSRIRRVAGLDVAYVGRERAFAAVVLFDLFRFEPVEKAVFIGRPAIPYIPGYLSFREAPPLLEVLRSLHKRPDALMCDGQGIAHPRGIGLASHIGVMLDLPSVGCAKSRLVGEYRDPGRQRGEWTPLMHRGRVVGSVLRTRTGVRPVFVSLGHRMGTAAAKGLVLKSAGKCRIPEPIRLAHIETARMKKEAGS